MSLDNPSIMCDGKRELQTSKKLELSFIGTLWEHVPQAREAGQGGSRSLSRWLGASRAVAETQLPPGRQTWGAGGRASGKGGQSGKEPRGAERILAVGEAEEAGQEAAPAPGRGAAPAAWVLSE